MTERRRKPDPVDLDWDDWNREHIAKHGMSQRDVEALVAGDPAVRQPYKYRLQLIGPTRNGAIVAVVIGPVSNRPGWYDTFSARPASRSERRFYREQRGGTAG
jgi:uncharacterized DUF497 family protein